MNETSIDKNSQCTNITFEKQGVFYYIIYYNHAPYINIIISLTNELAFHVFKLQ